MEFGTGGGTYSEEEEEEQMMMSKGNKQSPFSYSSNNNNSSSPSSSSSHHQHLLPLSQIYDSHHKPMGSNWLATNVSEDTDSASAAKLELMDMAVSNDEEEGGTQAESASAMIEKEHMFDKVVTPSDVGKLNRLVIPKQYAEKYFPLDSSTNEKGLLLNFEDRTGKPWRFRYSYWNSSQSYVMTKGWSRFVKEKQLDAGDIVSFQRGVGESAKDRLYIDWKRRPDHAPDSASQNQHPHHHFSSIPWSPLLMRPPAVAARDHLHFSNPNYRNAYYNNTSSSGGSFYGYGYNINSNSSNYNYNVGGGSSNNNSGTLVYMRSGAPQQVGMGMVQWQQAQSGGHMEEPLVFESVPVVQGRAAAKRLRLFGVNMDCPISDSHQCDQMPTSSNTLQYPSQSHLHHQHVTSSMATVPLQPSPHHPLQLRLYSGMPSSSIHKGKSSSSSSSMSLDLDI